LEAESRVTLKAKRAFSGSQTHADYLGRIEQDETFEALPDDATYLVRNGFADRVEETTPVEASEEATKPEPQNVSGAGAIASEEAVGDKDKSDT
jgi:hypothetical protein